jgi:hypothetical protein
MGFHPISRPLVVALRNHHLNGASERPESRLLVRLSYNYATEVRFVAATALLPMWSRSFSTSFTRPRLTS